MILFVSKYLIPKQFRGITFYPFIILSKEEDKRNKTLIYHEKIHIKQQAEMLVVLFFIWYVIEFLFRFLYCKNWMLAYRNISFEREAYENQKDLNYLKKRSFWSFLKYI
ncbi:hypothetical protein [Flavobacterium sp.]|uniref:hypothetical protein n=1 Tax=Flavobacterium sp. TaxID=239 RepID=UPI0040489458